jgi:hypothetical protein
MRSSEEQLIYCHATRQLFYETSSNGKQLLRRGVFIESILQRIEAILRRYIYPGAIGDILLLRLEPPPSSKRYDCCEAHTAGLRGTPFDDLVFDLHHLQGLL